VTVQSDQTTVLAVGAGGLVAEYRQQYEVREHRPEAGSP
jgi:hypothetical protein